MNEKKSFYNIVPITNHNRQLVMKSLKKYFFHDEPLNASIGLMEETESVKKLENFCDTYLQNEISFMAVSETGDLMGVILNDIISRNNIEKTDLNDIYDGSSKYDDIMILLNKIEKEVDVFGKYANVDRIMRIIIISVNKTYRGHGVCKALITKTKEMALEKRCQMIDVECSSYFTVKAVEKLGFKCIYSLLYVDYINEQGEVVFKPQLPHEHFKIYVYFFE